MDLTHLRHNLRMAGVAWVVSESASLELTDHDRHRTHIRARHWAIMRGLPIGSEAAYDAAIADAITYREEHAEDVQAFLDVRERERRRHLTGHERPRSVTTES